MKTLIIISITALLTTMAITNNALAGVKNLDAEQEILIIENVGGF